MIDAYIFLLSMCICLMLIGFGALVFAGGIYFYVRFLETNNEYDYVVENIESLTEEELKEMKRYDNRATKDKETDWYS